MKIKDKRLNFYYPLLLEYYHEELVDKIMITAIKNLDKIIKENPTDNKYEKEHTYKKIYPAISIYYSMLDNDIRKEDVVSFIDFALCKNSEKKAKSLRSLLKIPGLYKLMPKMFKKVTIKSFGKKAGFDYKFYDTKKDEVKFDMTKCLYYNTCKKFNCPEICKAFCHTDDVCNEHMHKKLKWNRTMTIGEGGEVCDFNLFLIDKNGKRVM